MTFELEDFETKSTTNLLYIFRLARQPGNEMDESGGADSLVNGDDDEDFGVEREQQEDEDPSSPPTSPVSNGGGGACLTIDLNTVTAHDILNDPMMRKTVIPTVVEMVKLPEVFLEHPHVRVKEDDNVMTITDLDTGDFIAKKIIYD